MYAYDMYACQLAIFCYVEIMNERNPLVENYLGALIRRLHQQSTAVFAEEMARSGYDLTPMQFATLKALSQYGDMDQARLAEYIACDRATMGGIIDRLERKAWIARRISPKDRRARIVSLTPAGQRLQDEVEPIVNVLQKSIAAELTDEEYERFMYLLQKSLKSVDFITVVSE